MKLTHIAASAVVLTTSLASAAAMAQNPSPYMQPNDTWISINGTVEDVSRNAFNLNYGDGAVIVEMDDGDRDGDAYRLESGDEVTVSGLIDHDFFETTSIEASSVFVEKTNTHFYVSPRDEEDYPGWYSFNPAPGEVIAQGVVSKVDDDHFTINRNDESLQVSVLFMDSNPLDDVGYHRIEVGDVVQVSGDLEWRFFDNAELEADSVVTLVNS